MPNLPPPPVPEQLREMLKDYPGYIDRLQKALSHIDSGPNLMPFDQAIWLLEGALGQFMSEAREELNAAEASGNAEAIARAKEKRSVMGSARFNMGPMQDLFEYFKANKGAFE
jgi:hypothetical protein